MQEDNFKSITSQKNYVKKSVRINTDYFMMNSDLICVDILLNFKVKFIDININNS